MKQLQKPPTPFSVCYKQRFCTCQPAWGNLPLRSLFATNIWPISNLPWLRRQLDKQSIDQQQHISLTKIFALETWRQDNEVTLIALESHQNTQSGYIKNTHLSNTNTLILDFATEIPTWPLYIIKKQQNLSHTNNKKFWAFTLNCIVIAKLLFWAHKMLALAAP